MGRLFSPGWAAGALVGKGGLSRWAAGDKGPRAAAPADPARHFPRLPTWREHFRRCYGRSRPSQGREHGPESADGVADQ
jgi:hypothetical protein